MIETRFTPGPWRVETSGRGSVCVVSDDAWICGEIDNQPHEMAEPETTANAHLIAAAPTLHLALQEALIVLEDEYGDQDQEQSDRQDRFRLILALARGEVA